MAHRIVLELEGGKLWLDAGEVRLELQALPSEAGAPALFVIVEGPLIGFPLRAGELSDPLILGSGVDEYEFVRLE